MTANSDPETQPSPESPEELPDRLFSEVYTELHRLARSKMLCQSPGHTLQPTALVSEAYLRLQRSQGGFEDRGHFLRVAAKAMRQILVDHARRGVANKRPPAARRLDLPLEGLVADFNARAGGIERLELALEKLDQVDPDLGRLVELHFFGGQTMDECARLLDISPRKAYRWWRTARAFLYRNMGGTPDGESD
jgi:RNA polymerase sigma factor (TIGR02999 family)